MQFFFLKFHFKFTLECYVIWHQAAQQAVLQHPCDAADGGQELTLLVDLELRKNRSKIEEEERFDLSKEGTFNNTNVLHIPSVLPSCQLGQSLWLNVDC